MTERESPTVDDVNERYCDPGAAWLRVAQAIAKHAAAIERMADLQRDRLELDRQVFELELEREREEQRRRRF